MSGLINRKIVRDYLKIQYENKIGIKMPQVAETFYVAIEAYLRKKLDDISIAPYTQRRLTEFDVWE